jgi:hypothetical protein
MTIFFRRLVAAVAPVFVLGLTGASPTPSAAVFHLAWRAPARGSQFDAASTVQYNEAFQMNGVLKAMAGHKADPIHVVEERSRTFAAQDAANEVYVDDNFARRHGGDHPGDTTVVRRERRQIVPFDPSGKYSFEPRLCKSEPPLNDREPHPTTYRRCPAGETNEVQQFQDPGDAALAELPNAPISVGQSWTFTRPVVVGRELSSGSLTYVDTLQRVEQRGSQHLAIINVAATGRIDIAKDLQARGFHTATMTFGGTAEFDLDRGTPGTQRYTGSVLWRTSILGARIGVAFDEAYDGKPWSAVAKR